ncbi:MAG: DMT family transporter [Filifactoraceae bacterium]
MKVSTISYIKIALAAVLWGSLGFFGKLFESFGFEPEMIAFSRLFTGWLSLVVLFGVMDRSVFKIDLEGLKYSAIIGFISHGLFNMCYFSSIRLTGAFTAAVLLYLSIIIMFFIGTIVYKEIPDKRKIISVIICMIGCILGVTGGDFAGMEVNLKGVVLGSAAAFFYSLMPSLSKKTILRYNPFTIIIYSFMFGFLLLIPFARPWTYREIITSPIIPTLMLVFGITVSTLPYCLYVPSLVHVEVSKLGVICSVELLMSIPIAVIILKENLTIGMLIGAALILVSIFISSTKKVR